MLQCPTTLYGQNLGAGCSLTLPCCSEWPDQNLTSVISLHHVRRCNTVVLSVTSVGMTGNVTQRSIAEPIIGPAERTEQPTGRHGLTVTLRAATMKIALATLLGLLGWAGATCEYLLRT